MWSKIRWNLGQTLVEVVAITGILVIVLVAMVAGVSRSVGQNQVSVDRTLATRLAQEPMEWVRFWRDRIGFTPLLSELVGGTNGTTVTYCLVNLPKDEAGFRNLSTGACGANNTIDNIYWRELRVVNGVSEIDLTSTVRWYDKNNLEQVVYEQTIHEWE